MWNTARFHLTLPDAVGVLAAVDTATGRVVWKNEFPAAFLGTSGPLVTAGGLLFRGSPGGQVEAYDVRTGVRRWAFRTSEEGSRLRPGPASAYELDGTQYIAVAMGPQLWAFTLDGAVPPRGEPSPDPPVDDRPSGPAPRETDEIETATLLENPRGSVGGRRYAFDEYNFNPVRARVTAGTRVRFTNNGEIPHTLAARDAKLEHRHAEPGPVGLRHVRRARDVPLSLRGPSLDGGGDYRRSVRPCCPCRRHGVSDSPAPLPEGRAGADAGTVLTGRADPASVPGRRLEAGEAGRPGYRDRVDRTR